MSSPATRISFDEFRRDTAGILDRVTRTGDRVEVVWGDARIALVSVGSVKAVANDERQTFPEIRRARLDLASLQTPDPETTTRRQFAIKRAEALGATLLAKRAGEAAVSNSDLINEEREARSRELEERWR